MKRFIGVLLFIGVISYTYSQKTNAILLIPFDSKMFNNQETGFMLEPSEMTYEQSIQYFTTSFDEHLTRAVKDSLKLYSLLRTYTTDATNDIDIVHDHAHYVYEDIPVSVQERRNLSAIEQHRQRRRQRQERTQPQQHPQGEIISIREDNSNKFLSAKFPDPQLFIDLTINYSAEYIVFATQFEILGDYSDPYEVGLQRYPRTMRVHYVIFDRSGNFVYGNVASTAFTARENNISEICANYMPIIAQEIARNIP